MKMAMRETALAAVSCLAFVVVGPSTIRAGEGDEGWISRNAAIEITGEAAQKTLPSFLTTDGEFHEMGKVDAYALSLKPRQDPGVVIDLGKRQAVRSMVIKNRGQSANQVGLTLWISVNREEWEKVWTARRAAVAWDVALPKGTTTRYLKLDRPDKNTDKPLELQWVKVYGPLATRGILDAYPWWPFVLILSALVLAYAALAIRYIRLARSAASEAHLARVAVGGPISKELSSHEAGLVLLSHFSSIRDLYSKTLSSAGASGSSLYGEVAEVAEFFGVPEWHAPSPDNLDLRHPVKIGLVEFFPRDIVDLLHWLGRRFFVPGLKAYLDSRFHLALALSGSEIQVTVSRPAKAIAPANLKDTKRVPQPPCVLRAASESQSDRHLSNVSALLRDATFMIANMLRGSEIPGRSWEGMKWFTEGIEKLDLSLHTQGRALLSEAIESFDKAARAHSGNYDILYVEGLMLLHMRTDEAVDRAIMLLTRALKSDDRWLRALVHSVLANCFVQRVHRLAGGRGMLGVAREHVKKAKEEYDAVAPPKSRRTSHPPAAGHAKDGSEAEREDPRADYVLAKRLYAEGSIGVVAAMDVRDPNEKEKREAKEKLIASARKLVEATALRPGDTASLNVLGYIHLCLAELEIPHLGDEERVVPWASGKTAGTAKGFFDKVLESDPTNKLVHANLCRLYASPGYRDDAHVDLCRKNGITAVILDKKYVNGYLDLAASLARHGKFEEAEDHYREALTLAETGKRKDDKKKEIKKKLLKACEDAEASEDDRRRFE